MNRLPTTDLYFLNACSHAVATWWRPAPIMALGANTFLIGETLLMIRRDTESLMRKALDWPHRLVYLIDDDIAGAARSAGLPGDYQDRLADFGRNYHDLLVERADHLVVSSPALQQLFIHHRAVTALNPFWSLPAADLDHFSGAGVIRPIQMAHLGSGSHAGALDALTPALLKLMAGARDVRLTYIARAGHHPQLEKQPRATRIGPMKWSSYRRWIAKQRFHIGLYPMMDTRFDRGRSVNKIIEHGIVGAAGVYPSTWVPAKMIGNGAIFAPTAAEDWFDVLASATDQPKKLHATALCAKDQLPEINSGLNQRSGWGKILETEI